MTRLLLIVGMHRSGTSAVAGAVATLGLPFGDDLLPGQAEDNPKGFFEHAELVAAHDALLAGAGRTWDDPSLWIAARPELPGASVFAETLASLLQRETADGRSWCAKDPRLCRLLPLWSPVLETSDDELAVLLVHRDPAAVARSLQRRNAFSRAKAERLWLDHVLGAERWSRGSRRAVVSFDELMSDAVGTLDRVGERLRIDWPRPPSSRREELREFLGGAARRPALADSSSDSISETAREVWRALDDSYPDLPPADALDGLADGVVARLGNVDALLVEHTGQVLERTVSSRLWLKTTPIETGLAETRRSLDDTSADLRTRLSAIEAALGRLATVAERIPELGLELHRHAGAISTAQKELVAIAEGLTQVGEELHRASRESSASRTSQEEALHWLASRLEALEDRPRSLLKWLRTRFRRG